MPNKALAIISAASVLFAAATLWDSCEIENESRKKIYILTEQVRESRNELELANKDIVDLSERLSEANETIESLKNASCHSRIQLPSNVKHYDIPLSTDFQDYIYAMCAHYEIPEHYELVLALIEHESDFVATAVSETNDYGLMQINEFNHEWLYSTLKLNDMLDPYQNVQAGVYMLSDFLLRYDNIATALMCYNLGEGSAKLLVKRGIRSSSYSESVLSIYREYIDK